VTAAQQLPDYTVEVVEKNVISRRGREPVEITLSVSIALRSIDREETTNKKSKGLGMTSCLVLTSDCHLVDFRRTP
jgi:hypothetical protein